MRRLMRVCLALLFVSALNAATIPEDFPRFLVPGHEKEMESLRALYWLHYQPAVPLIALWDEWMSMSTLWPAIGTGEQLHAMGAKWAEALSGRNDSTGRTPRDWSQRDIAVYRKERTFRGKEDSILTLDFSQIAHPRSIEAYNPVFHFPPVRQDTSGMCWCFSATSLLETELFRLGRGKIELSRLFTVYWEYVEKVRRFVKEKGNSLVDEGSQHNAVIARMKQYGAVRAADYTGLVDGAKLYDHDGLIAEIKTYLDFVKSNKLWYEDEVIANVRLILDRYLGKPPEIITIDGRQMTPKEYLANVLQLPLDDYIVVMSFKKVPFWTQDSYDVPDNWWHCKDYYNVPLDDFYDGIKSAIQKGYSLAIAGDISEPGNHGPDDLAIIPTFDIPAEFIDQNSREFRFYNKTTKDDHGVHLIGYKRFEGNDWFLIKDSWDTAWRGEFKGYFFYRGDYIKLKILAYMVHKDGISELMQKYQRNHGSKPTK